MQLDKGKYAVIYSMCAEQAYIKVHTSVYVYTTPTIYRLILQTIRVILLKINGPFPKLVGGSFMTIPIYKILNGSSP